MVVSDTSPLNYLVLINQINLLQQLYGRVLIPESVLEELSAIETPQLVRDWATNLTATVDALRQTSFHVRPKLLASIVDGSLLPTKLEKRALSPVR